MHASTQKFAFLKQRSPALFCASAPLNCFRMLLETKVCALEIVYVPDSLNNASVKKLRDESKNYAVAHMAM